jgi:hypothetical protein
MSIQDQHPEYTSRYPDWRILSDCFDGERKVKAAGPEYLPPTGGMIENGYSSTLTTSLGTATTIDTTAGGYSTNSIGTASYNAYRTRAVFHPFVHEAVTGLLGVLHRKPPVVEVPKALEPMLERMTNRGENLEQLWRRISEGQLKHGRLGLLVDLPSASSVKAVPFVALYCAEHVLNWDTAPGEDGREALQLVVLDESRYERQPDLQWERVVRVRVLATADVAVTIDSEAPIEAQGETYVVGEFRGEGEGDAQTMTISAAGWVAPSMTSSAADGLAAIPFVFVNTNDLVPTPDQPPLLGLANITLAIYRGEADYRQSLFMQGQDTLARFGYQDPEANDSTKGVKGPRIGAGTIMDFPPGGDLKYVGVSSQGIPYQKDALDADKQQAAMYSVQMLDTKGGDAESGEALRIRVSARTATLARLQHTAAAAIRDCLVYAGRWLGLGDAELDAIVVTPNLDFADDAKPAADIATIQSARVAGARISDESYHEYLVANRILTTTFEEESLRYERDLTERGGNGGTAVDVTGGKVEEGKDEEEPDPDADEDDEHEDKDEKGAA